MTITMDKCRWLDRAQEGFTDKCPEQAFVCFKAMS